MMFVPENDFQSILGSNKSGDAPTEPTFQASSSFTSIVRGSEQCLHSESIWTLNFSPRSRPCTKDVANASSAQAPKMFSPLEKERRCAVGSVVTGNAQLTSPAELRTRKNRCLSSSDRIADTR